MNVRDATPGDEPWLIETLDSLDSYDPGFRWYHYVVVTTDDGDRVGLGRITEHDEETVELDRVYGFGERPTVARGHAARGLVKRALEDEFETILAAVDSTRAFEAVVFRAGDADPLDPADGETGMRWVPPAEREDDEADTDEAGETEAESSTADTQPARETDAEVENSTASAQENASTTEAADDGTETTYKYDPDAAQPTTGATTAPEDSGSKDTTPEADDSTAAAARRQGFDPDRVETKYDTEDKTRSKTAKDDTDERGEARSDETDDDESATSSDDSDTKYDTDETDDSPNTKYSV